MMAQFARSMGQWFELGSRGPTYMYHKLEEKLLLVSARRFSHPAKRLYFSTEFSNAVARGLGCQLPLRTLGPVVAPPAVGDG